MRYASACFIIVILVCLYILFDIYASQKGIKAICNDGTVSLSKNKSGTCSHHGGVKEWR